MKAIAYQRFGNTEVLQTVEESMPKIQPNEVLVKIQAVSINPLDWKIRQGQMKLMSGSKFPKHTGADFSGIVEATGISVTGFKKGDSVFGVVHNSMKEGALAEYVAVPSSDLWQKPPTLSFAQAASIPMVGSAATTILEKLGNIPRNAEVLINGATGGLGMFLLQLLKKRLDRITAVTSTAAIPFARKWGADIVIDYKKEDVLTRNVKYDIIIDLSGKMGYSNAKRIMNPGAKFFNLTPQPIQIPAALLGNLFRGKKHVLVLSKPATKHIQTLLKEVNEGLQIEVSKVFPFSQVQEAYTYAEKGGIIGKVVIELN